MTALPRRIDAWDALRGVAVGLVLLRHAWPDAFGGAGIVGVTLFFGLSGFLITGIIATEVRSAGRLSFVRFYTNRFFRLIPPVFVMLAVYVVLELLFGLTGDTNPILSAAVGLCYLADIPGVHLGPGLGHLWTLAVEEQFYLVWPTLLILAFRRRVVAPLVLFMICAAMVTTIALLAMASSPANIYTLPTSWAPALLIGAGARLYLGRAQQLMSVPGVLPVSVVLLAAFCFVPEAKEHSWTYLVMGPLIGIAAVALMVRTMSVGRLPRVAEPLRALGIISYAAYLWNYPVVTWLPSGEGSPGWAILGIILTLVVATASLYVIERPSQRLKRRLVRSRMENRTKFGEIPAA